MFLVVLATMLFAQSLSARVDRDQLHIAAPRMHFLRGEALERLRNGATVNYAFQLTARTDRNGRVLARTNEIFAVSYDLWEEKFAATKLGTSSKSVSHLSPEAAEAWCVDNTTMPVATITGNSPFWLRIDYRADSPATPATEQQDNSSFTMATLIDIFSRRTRAEQIQGFEEVGPLRLENLKKR